MSQLMMLGAGSSGPGGGVSINDIAAYNPYVWLDAMSYAGAADSSVSTLANRGSLGGNFVQATGGKQPTYRATGLNSKPAFQFDGGDCLTIANVALTTFTMLVLLKATANGIIAEHSATASSNPGFYFYTSTGNTMQVSQTGTCSKDHTADWGISGASLLSRYVFGGSNATTRLWLNGTDLNLALGDAVSSTTVTDTLNIGARNNAASLGLAGHIAQLILFPLLSDANAAAVEAILTSVYNL